MNCNESNEDKMSVISDRCWEEKYKGDSKRWMIRDGTTKNSLAGASSTMKETYASPEPMDEDIAKGIRRKIVEKKLLAEVAQEIIDENNIPPPIEEYCTEYDGNFHYPGYDPNKKKERETELFLKYPLYEPTKSKFAKNALFTTPITENLEQDWV